ncbi:hypothetical protein NPIL_599141 [Nephila pilipes]|uniref:Uncharacterized protein n=1 Tax=Nephila pilipes TaxID=299642 RepID=A0A8X6TGL2_NEPPI|nr:hypothetical protein NPIL_599141 [Nephila pilipes]
MEEVKQNDITASAFEFLLYIRVTEEELEKITNINNKCMVNPKDEGTNLESTAHLESQDNNNACFHRYAGGTNLESTAHLESQDNNNACFHRYAGYPA